MEITSNLQLCRICITSHTDSTQLISIFGEDSLWQKITTLADVKIDKDDTLPQQVCVSCAKNAISACLFKKKCEDADNFFRQQLLIQKFERRSSDGNYAEDVPPEVRSADHMSGRIMAEKYSIVTTDNESHGEEREGEGPNNDTNNHMSPGADGELQYTNDKPPFNIQSIRLMHEYMQQQLCKINGVHKVSDTANSGDSDGAADDDEPLPLIPEIELITPADEVVATSDRGYQCPNCFQVFELLHILKAHMKSVHGTPGPVYECSNCRKTYFYKRFLEKHIRRGRCVKKRRNQTRPMQCSDCNVIFPTGHHLGWHKRTGCPSRAAKMPLQQLLKQNIVEYNNFPKRVGIRKSENALYLHNRKLIMNNNKRKGRTRIKLDSKKIALAKQLILREATTTVIANELNISRTFAWRLRKSLVNGVSLHERVIDNNGEECADGAFEQTVTANHQQSATIPTQAQAEQFIYNESVQQQNVESDDSEGDETDNMGDHDDNNANETDEAHTQRNKMQVDNREQIYQEQYVTNEVRHIKSSPSTLNQVERPQLKSVNSDDSDEADNDNDVNVDDGNADEEEDDDADDDGGNIIGNENYDEETDPGDNDTEFGMQQKLQQQRQMYEQKQLNVQEQQMMSHIEVPRSHEYEHTHSKQDIENFRDLTQSGSVAVTHANLSLLNQFPPAVAAAIHHLPVNLSIRPVHSLQNQEKEKLYCARSKTSSTLNTKKPRKPNVFVDEEKYTLAKTLVAQNSSTMEIARALNVSQMTAWKVRDAIVKGVPLSYRSKRDARATQSSEVANETQGSVGSTESENNRISINESVESHAHHLLVQQKQQCHLQRQKQYQQEQLLQLQQRQQQQQQEQEQEKRRQMLQRQHLKQEKQKRQQQQQKQLHQMQVQQTQFEEPAASANVVASTKFLHPRRRLKAAEREQRDREITREILELIREDSNIQYWKVSARLAEKGFPISPSSVCQKLKSMGIHRRWKPSDKSAVMPEAEQLKTANTAVNNLTHPTPPDVDEVYSQQFDMGGAHFLSAFTH